jgi:ATP phosphoribosyltransferase
MSAPFVLAVPSKGGCRRTPKLSSRAPGCKLVKPRGAREYRGAIAGCPGVEVAYLSASDITAQLALGAVHFGVTGEDQIRETIPDAEKRVVLIDSSASARRMSWSRCRRPGSTCAPWPTSTTSRPRSARRMTARCASRPSS